jgi:DNA ligase (NAD+)
LDPVEIDGTTVTNASLCNQDIIDQLGANVGDTVVVEKAGKIIPHILRVTQKAIKTPTTPSEAFECSIYQMPTKCPACGSEAVRDPDGVFIRCINAANCPAQLKAMLVHYASRKCMDIEGIGPELVNQLVDADLVTKLTDLYRLHVVRSDILALHGIGPKKCDKLLAALEKSKQQPFERLLSGLNIRRVGEHASRALVEQFGTAEQICEQTEDALAAVEGVGPATAKSFTSFIDNGGINLLAELAELGLSMGSTPVSDDGRPQPLAGKTIVVTGELQTLTRDAAHSAIRQNGGKAVGSVSKRTSFLVVGSAPGATKFTKATALGIPQLTEDELLELISAE